MEINWNTHKPPTAIVMFLKQKAVLRYLCVIVETKTFNLITGTAVFKIEGGSFLTETSEKGLQMYLNVEHQLYKIFNQE